jgi:hypothetical protein
MPQYVLLLRDDPAWFADYSAEEIQKMIQKYREWRTSLQSRIVAGHKLKDGEGHVLRKEAGQAVVTDGPFTEAKEVVGGIFVIEAASYQDMIELAKTCPHMDNGSIEVREIERT